MLPSVTGRGDLIPDTLWLRGYYFTRAAVAAGWVVLAVAVGRTMPHIAGPLLVAYPAWDALANWADAKRNGGLGRNKSQTLNFVASSITAVAVAIAVGSSINAAIFVFGIWAALAGIFQLVTAVRRWRSYGGQWAMALSGAQSALAGAFFLHKASGARLPDITVVAPYAAFGAFYFLVSSVWLTVAMYRRGAASSTSS
ncbi:MAG: DUF308 domain-containing protein [Pseudomonadota bacterium]